MIAEAGQNVKEKPVRRMRCRCGENVFVHTGALFMSFPV
jgi:hypothetical protein